MIPGSGQSAMSPKKTAGELLDMYFLDARCNLIETAAIFDRIERAANADEAMEDPRVKQLRDACDILKNTGQNRTEAFLMLFSEK